jgi:hypothetical protein
MGEVGLGGRDPAVDILLYGFTSGGYRLSCRLPGAGYGTAGGWVWHGPGVRQAWACRTRATSFCARRCLWLLFLQGFIFDLAQVGVIRLATDRTPFRHGVTGVFDGDFLPGSTALLI